MAVAELDMHQIVVPSRAGSCLRFTPVGAEQTSTGRLAPRQSHHGGYSSGTEAGLSSLSDGVSTRTVDWAIAHH